MPNTSMDDTYLEHYGIKGMKWGVRRYQNEDGTLTDAGKNRLKNYQDKEYARVSKRRDKAQDKYELAKHQRKGRGLTRESSKELRAKSIRDTYNKELEVIKKMSYKDMESDKIAVGKQWAKAAIAAGIGTVSVNYLIGPGSYMLSFPTPTGISNAKTRNRLKRADY